ncbi:hypothetical protein [Streptomyces sp. NPDC059909]|uniref:hypothetical protein n=1 Tax=Streptomyces sp. NPDC059909 TaxID=3346998 RepID=UPI003652D478
MSMQPKGPGEIPAETVRVARAAFPKGSLAIRVRDELGGAERGPGSHGLLAPTGTPQARTRTSHFAALCPAELTLGGAKQGPN